jgi:hypothetical protein
MWRGGADAGPAEPNIFEVGIGASAQLRKLGAGIRQVAGEVGCGGRNCLDL